MKSCQFCGEEFPAERKYPYCMRPECVQRGLAPLRVVAVGINKAAPELMALTEDVEAQAREGKFHDQRRQTYGSRSSVTGSAQPPRPQTAVRRPEVKPAPGRTVPGTDSQRRLAHLYRERGWRPARVAEELGVSEWAVTQMLMHPAPPREKR